MKYVLFIIGMYFGIRVIIVPQLWFIGLLFIILAVVALFIPKIEQEDKKASRGKRSL